MDETRKKLRKWSIIMAVVLVTSTMLACFAWLQSGVKAAGGGTGTADDPYIITTASELASMLNNLNAYYKLGKDIDLSGFSNFEPIGFDGNPFTGGFDGAGYTITGLKVNLPGEQYVGFFGYVGYGSKIKNVKLQNVQVKGSSMVGGLAGQSDGDISNSYVVGTVTGVQDVGGLIGKMDGGTVNTSYASGSVTGTGNVGGLAGSTNYGNIQNSYADNTVSGTSNVGGLVGLNGGPIKNSLAVGRVTGASDVGGLVGKSTYSGVQNSIYDKETTGQSDDNNKGMPFTTAQMKDPSFVKIFYWDFDTIWSIAVNEYPKLRVFQTSYTLTYDGNGNTTGTSPASVSNPERVAVPVPGNPGNLTRDGYMFVGWNTKPDGSGTKYDEGDNLVMGASNFTLYAQWTAAMAGSGTVDDPYIVTTATQFDAIRVNTRAFYKLANDIDLGSYTDHWKPIGVPGMYKDFAGGLDGNGHVISGVKVNVSTNFAGLFGILGQGGQISNVRVEDVQVQGTQYVGGLVGSSNGIITNSSVEGTVSGTGNYVGGLVGMNSRASVRTSYASGSVSGASYVGGLVGSSEGYWPDYPEISNSYAMVTVTGTGDYVGGMAGRSMGNVTNTYAVGQVTGNGSHVDGLLGTNQYSLAQSVYNVEVAGPGPFAQVGQPTTTAMMKVKSTYYGWDFSNIWSIDEGYTYPMLRAFQAPSSVIYNGNGSLEGTVPTDSNRYPEGSPVTVLDNSGNLKRNGYVFTGWNTKEDGSGQAYAGGDQFNMGPANVTLYAQWSELTYTVASLGDQNFTELKAGYAPGSQETKSVTVTRTGTGDLANLSVSLNGVDADKFVVTVPVSTTLNDGTPATTFTVKAKDNLIPGIYSATVKVSADRMTDVTFTVNQAVKAKAILKGDANGDGLVTPADALMITQYLKGKITLTDDQFKALDMDDNQVLDNTDVQMIMAIYLGGAGK
ncbi:InlB B-repeat-containing protein [Paenibacillus sp. Marseille-P2973]|uniref:GLUG motif-containing protein n=1 Tax=Paenibacillus sp. Marseille-P2973 TaxID=1871032 RepID=UPI001B35A99F|nr:GLUG motif-containing protein [Paenibacillus sp. Marseille-P2973]MBQ4899832.1 InlB B-repeat-containing protein [Paenibacillus sp. Marseille-P2973]